MRFHRASRWRIAAWLVVVVVLALGATVIVLGPRQVKAAIWRGKERARLLLTGRLVDVGGYRLHVERWGKGSPTVVMDAGLCQPLDTWGAVPAGVAAFTSVVAYDRAGLGWSDPIGKTRTSDEMVAELHILLERARIPPPYVLVGHSFGGLNVRLYAQQYPDEVVGMVLVDASHAAQVGRIAALLPQDASEGYVQHEGGGNCERVDIVASGEEVAAAPLPAMPLVILTAERGEWPEGWPIAQLEHLRNTLQDELAALTPDSVHIVVSGSGHFIQLDRPEMVIDAIRTVVEQARRETDTWR